MACRGWPEALPARFSPTPRNPWTRPGLRGRLRAVARAKDDSRRKRSPRQLLLFDGKGHPRSGRARRKEPAPVLASERESPALPDLKSLFDRLNQRFFEGRLKAKVSWSNRLTASAGSCDRRVRHIQISVKHYLRRPDLLQITLSHEMLHLIVPDHGPKFKELGMALAKRLRVSWREFRYAELWADLSRYSYVYACPVCGVEIPSRNRRRGSCGLCGPGKFQTEFLLVLTESRTHPGPVLLGQRPVRTRVRGETDGTRN